MPTCAGLLNAASGIVCGRSTRSLGVMAISYPWECKFCGRGNAAGTDHCAVCRNPAIARPIDFDPRLENERLDAERRRKQLETIPPPLRPVVATLWGICVVGAIVAKVAWSIGVGIVGLGVMIVTGIPAALITKAYEAERPKRRTSGMRVIEFSRNRAQPIALFGSSSASSIRLADGQGEAHVYCVYFEPGGCIGEHPAGFDQLFLVMDGSGWVAGADGSRVTLTAGQGVIFENGEHHSKGSEGGMTALMVQVSTLQCAESGQ